MAKGKELQCAFRIGTYGIMQIPLNVVVGELAIKKNGDEHIIQSTKTYHSNMQRALENVYDRLLADKAHKATLSSVKGLIELIKEAKQEIIDCIG